MDKELLTPTEILEKFKNTGLSVYDVGNALKIGVLVGKKVNYGCVVSIESFKHLLEYRKNIESKNSKITSLLKQNDAPC